VARKKKNRALVPVSPPIFAEGAAVRVKPGVADPDYPDIPLGGWAGTVQDIDQKSHPPLYEVAWSDATVERMHPVYQRRCERDGLEGDSTWLREADLEPDAGGELVMEQPTQIVPRPLDPHNPTEVALGVFGLTSDDELPPVNEETLRRFHEYLSDRLRFPFTSLCIADHLQDGPGLDMMHVHRLLPFDASAGLGLEVEATRNEEVQTIPLLAVQAIPNGPNFREVEAYRCWIDEQGDGFEPVPASRSSFFLLLVLVAMTLGMLIGALLEAVPGATLAAQVGGGLLALVGALVGAMMESGFRKMTGHPDGVIGGLILGALWGAALGAGLGGMVLVSPGAIAGALAGTIGATVLRAFGKDWGVFKLSFAGAALGSVGWAFLVDASKAATGATLGAFAGLGGALLSGLAVYLYLRFVLRPRP
jgi:hypothetical protein